MGLYIAAAQSPLRNRRQNRRRRTGNFASRSPPRAARVRPANYRWLLDRRCSNSRARHNGSGRIESLCWYGTVQGQFMESFANIGTPFDAYVTTSEILQPARVRPNGSAASPSTTLPRRPVRGGNRRTFMAQAHSRVRQNPNRSVSDATELPAGRQCHFHSWLLRHADSRLASLPQPALPKVRIP